MTSAKYRGIIAQVAYEATITSNNREKISKKVKKLLKKVLTSEFECGIISKSLREWRQRSLKIEQQERSTKLKIVCVLDLEQFKENTTQQK